MNKSNNIYFVKIYQVLFHVVFFFFFSSSITIRQITTAPISHIIIMYSKLSFCCNDLDYYLNVSI